MTTEQPWPTYSPRCWHGAFSKSAKRGRQHPPTRWSERRALPEPRPLVGRRQACIPNDRRRTNRSPPVAVATPHRQHRRRPDRPANRATPPVVYREAITEPASTDPTGGRRRSAATATAG